MAVDRVAVFDVIADLMPTLTAMAENYREQAANLLAAVGIVEAVDDLDTLRAVMPSLGVLLTKAASSLVTAAEFVEKPPATNPAAWKLLIDLVAEEAQHD